MLGWAKQFNIFCFLDNQQYQIAPHKYECLLGVEESSSINSDNSKFSDLDNFLTTDGKWKFGHISYDSLNNTNRKPTCKEDYINFPGFFFFIPKYLFVLTENELKITADDPDELFRQCMQIQEQQTTNAVNKPIQQKLSKDEYISIIKKLQEHILRGDCYEINFCQQFFINDIEIDSEAVFLKLMEISPNPFSAFYKLHDKYLICASPERFLWRERDRILSQPMKGTIKRNVQNNRNDEELKDNLYRSEKERAENVMVVDLVRNDLSKVCRENSIEVEELFGIYTFPQVHQMTSTITGVLKKDATFTDILSATFPMGSMTGAPKQKVMQLIEKYELSTRGIFSGSVGYISPDGSFDFNVVIRSILYNAKKKYLCYMVGSGITFYSDPEKEWEECLLKAEAIKKVLT